MRAQFKLRNGNGEVMGWVKIASFLLPFVVSVTAGAVVIGENLRETRENAKDIVDMTRRHESISTSIQNLELVIQRDHFIDSLMFVNQAKMMRKLGIEP